MYLLENIKINRNVLNILVRVGIATIALFFIGCSAVSVTVGDDGDNRVIVPKTMTTSDPVVATPTHITVQLDAPNLRIADNGSDTIGITISTTPALDTISELAALDRIIIPIIIGGTTPVTSRIEKSGNGVDFSSIGEGNFDVVVSTAALSSTLTLRVNSDSDVQNEQFTIEIGTFKFEGQLAFENYRITIAALPGTTLINNMLNVEIIDSSNPSISAMLDPATLEEGGDSVLTLTFNEPIESDVPVTATVGADIPLMLNGAKTALVTLSSANPTASIPIKSIENERDEADTSYSIDIATTTGVMVLHPTLILRVIDNDVPALTLTPAIATIIEGAQETFTITAAIAPYQNITVHYSLSGTVGTRSASTEDYTDANNGMVTIDAGTTEATINIMAAADAPVEQTEHVTLTLDRITPDGGAVIDGTMNRAAIMISDPGVDTDGDTIADVDDSCPAIPNKDDQPAGNACNTDIDDDNDGLIEIYTLAQFDTIRYSLAGTGYKSSSTATATTTGASTDPTTYCSTSSVDGVYLCGYELMNDLDFDTDGDKSTFTLSGVGRNVTAAGDSEDAYYNGGAGWEPIAHCDDTSTCSTPFTGIFEGNGHTISNLYINYSGTTLRYGTGLFGAATNRIQNLRLDKVYVKNRVSGESFVGGLAGYAKGSTIQDCSITEGIVHGLDNVGGLIGYGLNSTITSSRFHGSVIGADKVGGLAGTGAAVMKSFVTGDTDDIVAGQGSIGGLVGFQSDGVVAASYAAINLEGSDEIDRIGGLVGSQLTVSDSLTVITASYATGNISSGNKADIVGGLVGQQLNGTIVASYAAGSVNGGRGAGDYAGGLVGQQVGVGTRENMIVASYATGDVDGGRGSDDYVGGLVGGVGTAGRGVITASYAAGTVTGGDGTGDTVGTIVGRNENMNMRIIASYGFGSVTADENNGISQMPPNITTATALTMENAGTCSISSEYTKTDCEAASGAWTSWNEESGGMHAWDFGTTTQIPALRFADYSSDTNYCTLIGTAFADGSEITCGGSDTVGTLLPGQR